MNFVEGAGRGGWVWVGQGSKWLKLQILNKTYQSTPTVFFRSKIWRWDMPGKGRRRTDVTTKAWARRC